MTSAEAARQVPWLRYALLGVLIAAIWLGITLFSSASGASAEAAAPDGQVSAAGAATVPAPRATASVEDASSEVVEPVAPVGPVAEPVAPVAEPVAPVGPVAEPVAPVGPVAEPAAAPVDAPATEPAAAPVDAPAAEPAAVPVDAPATEPAAPVVRTAVKRSAVVGPAIDADSVRRAPAAPAAEVAVQARPSGETRARPDRADAGAPSDRADEQPVPPGGADKADRTPPAPASVPAPQNAAPPGLADKPVGAPAVAHSTDGHADDAVPGAPGAQGVHAADTSVAGSQVSGPPVGARILADDDWSAPASSTVEDSSVPGETSGAITPADDTPSGGAASGSPAPGGGAGSGGAGSGGAGSGTAGTSGISDAAFAAGGLGALASLVLHSVDDDLPSSPVYDTDTTPD